MSLVLMGFSMKMTGARAMVESLRKENVEIMFGILGGSIIPFYDEILSVETPRHILVRHEQCAAHAAEGYAKVTGKVGVCVSTSGPGATNLVTGIADAYNDSVPIVALSGQVPTALIGNDAFQEVDSFGLFMAITKHNFRINHASEIPDIVKKAFHLASTGRPGPVHIDFPKDTQTQEFDFEYPKTVELQGYRPQLNPHPAQIKRAAHLLLTAERPVILAGGGVIISNAHQELSRLAESLGIPVVTTLMGKGAINEYHPLSLGMVGMHGRTVANYALSHCDVMLAIGVRFSDRVTGDLTHFAKESKIIHIDIDSAEIGKNVPVEVPIVADAKKALRALLEEVAKAKSSCNSWQQKIKEYDQLCRCEHEYDECVPIHPIKVVRELNRVLPENTVICTEVGQHQMWTAHFIRIRHSRQWVTSGGLGTMGFGFPAAMGAKAADPTKPVIDVAGDGSFMMVMQEVATTVSENLPIVVVIMNNNWLGMVKQWQKLFFDKRYSATHLKKMPDFVKLAEAFGAMGERVTKPSDVGPAIKRGLASDTTYIIDVIVDPEADILPMVPPGGRIDSMILSDRCPRFV